MNKKQEEKQHEPFNQWLARFDKRFERNSAYFREAFLMTDMNRQRSDPKLE